MSEDYQHLFKEINTYLEEIKKSAETNDDILKDMSQQSDKLGSCISYLRQFMFMHNIHFDNSKFLNDQNQQSEYESNTNLRNTNKSNTQMKSQQKVAQQSTAFFQKSKTSQINNNQSIQELTNQKRDKSPISNNIQQNYQGSQMNDQYQHQNSQQSQSNPPSKLSNMLSSILQERKSKPITNNSKSGIISTKKS